MPGEERGGALPSRAHLARVAFQHECPAAASLGIGAESSAQRSLPPRAARGGAHEEEQEKDDKNLY